MDGDSLPVNGVPLELLLPWGDSVLAGLVPKGVNAGGVYEWSNGERRPSRASGGISALAGDRNPGLTDAPGEIRDARGPFDICRFPRFGREGDPLDLLFEVSSP